MEIKFSIDDVLDVKQKAKLKQLLSSVNKPNLDEDELKKALTKIAKASFEEYKEMILGQNLPTKANEFLERRLYHLLKRYFIDRFPNENEVISLFQQTESGSRTLLRNVRAKYKYELETSLKNTIVNILTNPSGKSGSNVKFIIRSENVLEELKQVVSLEAPELEQITKVRSSAGVYTIHMDTLEKICTHYSIPITDITEKLDAE